MQVKIRGQVKIGVKRVFERQDVLRLVRKAQRNAAQHWLEAAARAVCPEKCGIGCRPSKDNEGRPWHGSRLCAAWPIHELLETLEDPAPAVECRRGGVVIERGKTPSGNDVTYMTREDPACVAN